MRFTMMLGLSLLCGMPAWATTDAFLLAPADPSTAGRRLHYAPVTAGLKRFDVVDPKDWIELNKAVGPQRSKDGRSGNRDGAGH